MKLPSLPLLLIFLVWACSSGVSKNERVARRYCGSCHLFPSPELLDKKTWEARILPEMAVRMGMDITGIPAGSGSELQEIMKSLPAAPLISTEEWNAIHAYYREASPDTLALPAPEPSSTLSQFRPETLTLPVPGNTMLTLVRSAEDDNHLVVGTRNARLYTLNHNLTVLDSLPLESAPSEVIFTNEGEKTIACMGIMDPNDVPAGRIVRLAPDAQPEIIIDSLKRPVDIASGDFDGDGDADLLVSAFGNYTGNLALYENNNEGYTQHVLHHFPGTRRVVLTDVNGDGRQDFYALITQGDEHIALFINRGKFRFSYRVVLRFPPVYGSSYFELADFNGDGADDILYTNGDNADYSPILKPYHGVRIFLNDGKDHFRESWFYPMHGASMAMAADFDKDGDTDIAAISFFPDFAGTPGRGFLYFENKGGSFIAFETPAAAAGRWITMEVADIDDDQDSDIILGALNFPTGVPDSLLQRWNGKPTSLLVLRNTLR